MGTLAEHWMQQDVQKGLEQSMLQYIEKIEKKECTWLPLICLMKMQIKFISKVTGLSCGKINALAK